LNIYGVALSNLFHKILGPYVNLFVEPLKKLLPYPVWFYRTDNKEGFLAWRERPLGYWVGHVVAYALLVAPLLLLL